MAAPARSMCGCAGRAGRDDAVRPEDARTAPRKGVSQKEMAAALGVSAAYLSALEHGRRGAPTWAFVQKMIGYFNVIWDDAEDLRGWPRSPIRGS